MSVNNIPMQFLKTILKNYSKILLVIIFVIAVILRIWYLPQKAISFAYDQARDAFVVQEMLGGHLKILGPSVSGVPGLFHGVLYYYVITPLYFIGQGNPVIVAYGLSLISSLGIFVTYFLAKLLTKNKIPALIAALMFAVSFEATQYANLLTNASMGVWFIPIFYIGLYMWITHSASSGEAKFYKWTPVITGLGFGLAVQSEIALAYHLIPLIIWLFIFRKNISKKSLILFSLSFFVAILTMIVAEIKFGFTGTSGIFYLLSGQDGISQTKNLIDYFSTLINQSGKTFAFSIFPLSVVFGGLMGFVMVIFSLLLNLNAIKKYKLTWETFLVSYIFAYAFALPFGGWNMKHILVGVAPAVCIYVGIFIWNYFSKYKLMFSVIVVVILFTNVFMILKENKNGQTIFPLQTDLILQKEINAISYTYQESKGEPFSISTLTSPLYVNTLWSYLYNWYGKSEYGYLPSWIGNDQIGQLGNNLVMNSGNAINHYYIIEPTYGIPELYVNYSKGDQDAVSKYIDKITFGEIVVEKRYIKK